MRRWACEGLSYLTLDADVKEKLVNDRVALRSMIQLAEVSKVCIALLYSNIEYLNFFFLPIYSSDKFLI